MSMPVKSFRSKMEQEDADPPSPPVGKNKIREGVKASSKKADVIYLGSHPIQKEVEETFSDEIPDWSVRLREHLQAEVGHLMPQSEDKDLPPWDEEAPALAEGASPAQEDDSHLLEAWLELNTPIGATKHIHTRPAHLRQDKDYVYVDGVKCLAPQRLRRVRKKVKVPDASRPSGRKTVYEYYFVPDAIGREKVRVTWSTGGVNPRNVSETVVRYSATNNSPLRGPWNCSVVYLGRRYFEDPKYAGYVRKCAQQNSHVSDLNRDKLGKTNSPPPVLSRSRPTRSVHWLCTHPQGSRLFPEVEEAGYICPTASNVNFENACKAHDVMDHLAQSRVDIEALQQESVLLHRQSVLPPSADWRYNEGVELPIQYPEVQSGVRKFLSKLAHELEHLPESSDTADAPHLQPDYEWAAANDPAFQEDDIPFGEPVEPVPYSPSEQVPYRTRQQAPHLEQSMAGWVFPHGSQPYRELWYEGRELKHIGREEDGAVSEQSQPETENVCFVRSDGLALKTQVGTEENVRQMVAYGVSRMQPRSIKVPEVDGIVRVSENVLLVNSHGRTELIDMLSDEGMTKLQELTDTFLHVTDELLALEAGSNVKRGELPTIQNPVEFLNLKPIKQEAPRKLRLSDLGVDLQIKVNQRPLSRLIHHNSKEVCARNFKNYWRTARELELRAFVRSCRMYQFMTAIDTRESNQHTAELNFYRRCSQRGKSRQLLADRGVVSPNARRLKLLKIKQRQLNARRKAAKELNEQYRSMNHVKTKRGLRKKYLQSKRALRRLAKMGFGLTMSQDKRSEIAATPPTVGEASPEAEVGSTSRKGRIYPELLYDVLPDNDLDKGVALEITDEDITALNRLSDTLRTDLPVEYLDREAIKIHKLSVAQRLAKHRAHRQDLAA